VPIFSAEQHLEMAKLLRKKAGSLGEPARTDAIKRANEFIVCAVLAAKHRGGISTDGFDFDALNPEWAPIDIQTARLDPVSPNGNGVLIEEGRHGQVRQLIKQAIEAPTPEGLADFLNFATKFRRLSIWNARMAQIQRPGARIIASEREWQTIGRYVLPDAVPIMILWPFSPIRFVFELEDTGPPIDRESIHDPFAAQGEFRSKFLSALESNLKKRKNFIITIEKRRQGFSRAGTAAAQGNLWNHGEPAEPIGKFVRENTISTSEASPNRAPAFRVTVNDRLEPKERFVTIAHELGHIFSGHLGACASQGNQEEESGWPDRRRLGKDEREVEAEAIAFLVASRAGLVTRSAAYLAAYARRADMTKVDVELIVRSAARIEPTSTTVRCRSNNASR
jgi:hypothetical protein